jgi:hypothetical protein
MLGPRFAGIVNPLAIHRFGPGRRNSYQQILADPQQIVVHNHQPNDEKEQGSHYTINSG